MAWYRIQRVKILDESKVIAIADEIRESVSALGADSIEMATGEDGTGTVIARYPDKASMEAATETAMSALKRFFEDGASDPSTLEQWTGEVTYTFQNAKAPLRRDLLLYAIFKRMHRMQQKKPNQFTVCGISFDSDS